LGRFLTGTVPTHPNVADHMTLVTDWGLYGNDQYGDCGPVSVANYIKLVTRYLTAAEISVSQDDVFDLYRRSGNPQFDPATDADDNGVDMQTMLEALTAGGIGGGHKPVAFAKVDATNLDEVRAAIAIFGGVLFGVTLDVAQQTQTDDGGPWDYRRSSVWGGHAIVAGKYTSATSGTDVSVCTWGELIGCTDAFMAHQLEECWVVIFQEHLDHPAFQEGVDLAALAADYTALTGRSFPVPEPVPEPPAPTPAPVPVPPAPQPADLDRQLGDALRAWLAGQPRAGTSTYGSGVNWTLPGHIHHRPTSTS